MCNFNALPPEIFYLILDTLSPFDIINFTNVYPYPLHLNINFKTKLENQIIQFSDDNNSLSSIIYQMIVFYKEVDYNILNLFKELFGFLRKSSKYMDILGYSFYIFKIKKGKTSVVVKNIFEKDSQIIYLYFPDTKKLSFCIENFLKFTKKDNDKYIIRNYHIRNNY